MGTSDSRLASQLRIRPRSYMVSYCTGNFCERSVDCTHCDLMDPLMKQLEEETGMTLRKFEVWYNDDNLRLLQRLDKVRHVFFSAVRMHALNKYSL